MEEEDATGSCWPVKEEEEAEAMDLPPSPPAAVKEEEDDGNLEDAIEASKLHVLSQWPDLAAALRQSALEAATQAVADAAEGGHSGGGSEGHGTG